MRTKAAVAIFLLAIFALSAIAMIRILPGSASGGSSNTLTLPDAELMLAEFTWEWGPGTLTLKTDIAGPGVQFDFTGLDADDTGVGDNFAVNALAGGTYKDYGYGFAGPYDFSGYKRYSLCIENVGTDPVTVCIFMNTGWTNDWSGGQWIGPDGFGASPERDTYWRSDFVEILSTECKVITLDFSSATCYNADDDPVLAWQHPDGTSGVTVRRLDEVSNIGFQVIGNGAGSIVVKGTQLYIDPPIINKAPGDVCTYFDVSVTLENFANFAGFDIKLTWDGTVITETAVDYTTYLNALWGAGKWSVEKEESGVGYYRLVAVALATSASNTGASVLFKKTFHVDKGCNIPLQTSIHFALVKLSDTDAKSICAVVTDGMYYMSATVPDLEFVLHDPNPLKPFEYCKIFEVEVWVTDICANLKDYDFIILYDSELLKFVDVDYWGVLGGLSDNAHVELLAPGRVHVWDTGGLVFNSGNGLLFALTFHVEFDDRIEHIWRVGQPHALTAWVKFEDATLSFEEGTIPMSGIIMPPQLNILVNLIKGDVVPSGEVDLFDLRCVAAFYDQPGPAKYDLTCDGTIDVFDLVVIATNFGYTHDP